MFLFFKILISCSNTCITVLELWNFLFIEGTLATYAAWVIYLHWLILIQKFSLFSHTFHLQNQKSFPQESGFPFHKNRQIKFKKQTGSKIFPKNLILSLFKWVFNFEMLNFLINYYYYYYFFLLFFADYWRWWSRKGFEDFLWWGGFPCCRWPMMPMSQRKTNGFFLCFHMVLTNGVFCVLSYGLD